MERSNNNPLSFVYINHYALFTSESLKTFENGQRFEFKYQKEVQKFYDSKQPSSPILQHAGNSQLINFNESWTEPSTLSSKNSACSSQTSVKSPNSLHSSQSSVKSSSSIHSLSGSAHSSQSSVKSSSSARPIPPKHLNPPSSKQPSLYSSTNSTKGSPAPSTKSPSSVSSISSGFSSSSHASVSLNSSFDSVHHASIRKSPYRSPVADHVVIDQVDQQSRMSADRPTIQSARQPLKIEKDQFLQEIRNFKFNPAPEKPSQKIPLFRLNSNPLLTSEHLHNQLDKMRQQFNGSTTGDETDTESQGQWDVI